MEERLQKLLSAAGVCSRRAAEEYITAGRVSVNGVRAELGQKADPERDTILVDGRPLGERPEFVYVMLNKPRGYVTTLSDEQGRRTVADLVKEIGVRIYPVGRLDRDSEGLLLMTNDGDLTQHLLHPSHEVSKLYHVSVTGPVLDVARRLESIRDVQGVPIQPAEVSVIRQDMKSADLAIVIHEGKNRQIRRMCAQCDLTVKRLQRVREHTVELGDLPVGKWRYLTEKEICALRES